MRIPKSNEVEQLQFQSASLRIVNTSEIFPKKKDEEEESKNIFII